MRKRFLVAVALWVCILGCEDAQVGDVLQDLVFPSTEVTELPPEMWEGMAIKRQRVVRLNEWVGKDVISEEKWNADIERAKQIEKWQQEFYDRYVNAGGIGIIGNSQLPDKHFIAARDAILIMTSKYPGLRDRLQIELGFYMILIGNGLELKDIPELRMFTAMNLRPACSLNYGELSPGIQGYCYAPTRYSVIRDKEILRAYGLDLDTPLPHYRYGDGGLYPLRTFIHEFMHALDSEMQRLDPTFETRIKHAYETAILLGTWRGEYAESAYWEYLAEGVVKWFYHIGEGRQHSTLADFFSRDPLLAELLSEFFPVYTFPLKY